MVDIKKINIKPGDIFGKINDLAERIPDNIAKTLKMLGISIFVIGCLVSIFNGYQEGFANAKEEGMDMSIDSGFRTVETQNYLYQNAIKKYETADEAIKWVLPGDLSRHPWGLAIDVNLNHDKSGASWLEANGATFGLCRVYENEWWHFEPLIAPGGICPPLLPDASHLK